MKTSYFIYIFALLFSSNMLAQKNKNTLHQLQGLITNNYSEPTANATVTIYGNNKLYQTYSDSNGNYCFNAIYCGDYIVNVLTEGYCLFSDTLQLTKDKSLFIENFSIKTYYIDGIRVSGIIWFGCAMEMPEPIKPIIINASKAPNQNINAIAAYVRGVDSRNGETPSINGAKPENTAYYIDGVRIAGMQESYSIFVK